MTVSEVFEKIKAKVAADPARVANLKASYQFELTGEGGGTYHASFDNGAHQLGEGALPTPGCTITMAAADFLAMVQGKLNPMAAFMAGKLKVKGDMGMAMKLQQLLS